jgi:hypothetical protein
VTTGRHSNAQWRQVDGKATTTAAAAAKSGNPNDNDNKRRGRAPFFSVMLFFSYQTIIERQGRDDGFIAFAPFLRRQINKVSMQSFSHARLAVPKTATFMYSSHKKTKTEEKRRKRRKEERKRKRKVTHPKLIDVQTAILILVHHFENLPHALLGGILILGELDHGAHHFINRLDNGQHLLVADGAVAVDVVELKGPFKLILHFPARGDGQGADEFFKVDAAGFVGVEDVKDVVGEAGGVAKGEELLVDFLEFGFGEGAVGAVLEEACCLIFPSSSVQPFFFLLHMLCAAALQLLHSSFLPRNHD